MATKKTGKAKKTATKKVPAKKTVKKVAAKKVAAKKSAGGRPRGTGTLPASDDHSPTLRSLAVRLTRDLKTVRQWEKAEGNPGRDKTGQFHVPSWLKWMADTGKNFKDTSDAGKNARARKAEVDAEIQEIKLQRLRGESIEIDEAVEVFGRILGDLKQEILSFGQVNSERLAGQDQGSAEKILNERLWEMLQRLAVPDEKKNEGDSQEFWKTVSEKLFPLPKKK